MVEPKMESRDETCIAPTASCSQLASEYLESCQRHNTPPIDTVLQQIRTLPDASIGGNFRAFRLTLSKCALLGTAPAYALEAVLRKVQFRRLEIEHVTIDVEGVEALFDMIMYYMSVTRMSLSGDWHINFQAASKIITKSCQLEGLEVVNRPLEPGHAPALARALRDHSCRLRALCLQRARISGEPLLCIVTALKSNNSVVELQLGDNGLTENDAAQLSSLLRCNSRLQLLDLSDNQIQDVGAGHIALSLLAQAQVHQVQAQGAPTAPRAPPLQPPANDAESRGLSVLVLSNNRLTSNCAQHLSRALRSSRTLCELNIDRNALGAAAVRELQAAGPLVWLGFPPGAGAGRTRSDSRPQNEQRAGRKRSTRATLNKSKKRKNSSYEEIEESEREDIEESDVNEGSDEEMPGAPTNESDGDRPDSSQFPDVPNHFQPGNYVLIKSDIKWHGDKVTSNFDDFNVWKIAGKALLQKYIPVESAGKIIYKCTCVYTGWNINNRDSYYSITDILDRNPKTDIKDECVAFDLNDLIKVREK